MRALLVALLLGFTAGSTALAADAAAGCHCYRQRTFDPERPWAVDRYILATARSSLLSAAYGVDKRTLVQSVMTGTTPDDLWIAYWAAARTQARAHELLAARHGEPSWAIALRESAGRLGEPFRRLVSDGAADAEIAAAVVDDVLVQRVGVEARTVVRLRADRATTEQVVLSTLLSRRLRTPAPDLLAEVRSQKSSWGAILDRAGVAPKDLDAIIRQQFR
jgi:hypothetical protein